MDGWPKCLLEVATIRKQANGTPTSKVLPWESSTKQTILGFARSRSNSSQQKKQDTTTAQVLAKKPREKIDQAAARLVYT